MGDNANLACKRFQLCSVAAGFGSGAECDMGKTCPLCLESDGGQLQAGAPSSPQAG